MISSMTASRRSEMATSGACCVEMTTVSSRLTAPVLSYSTETWLLPSGRSQARRPLLRAAVSDRASIWAYSTGAGISVCVSSQAKPNIMPWSPAPVVAASSKEWSTPMAISPDCSSMAVSTAQDLPVEARLGVVIADAADCLPGDLGDIHIAGRGNLAHDQDHPRCRSTSRRRRGRSDPGPG